MYRTITVEKNENFAVLTFNRPDKLNAVNTQLKKEVYQVLGELEAAEDVRVVIMTGAGRAFSSGWDLTDEEVDQEFLSSLKEEEKLLYFEKPLIAAVNGYALGGGVYYRE